MKTQCATCGSSLMKGGGLDQLCGACLFEGSRRPPAADLPDRVEQEEVARLFPDLEILEPLGQGGMGVVWRARQKRLDREVALKLLRPELAEQPGFAERFQREARALAKLSHPNVVVVHDFGEERGRYFLLMEFVKGVGLRDLIRDGRLMPARVLEIVPEICAGLQYAHENGVIHRDIKPENILLDREGKVKIADFGLAKLANAAPGDFSLTGASQVMGTVHYIAPEQMETPKQVDHRADIYSLGVVFYEMLTGELPLGRFLPPSEKVSVDVRLDEVVLRSLERERERRYQRADELKSGVESAVSGAAESTPRVSTGRAPSAGQELPALAVVGALGLPAGVLVAVLIHAFSDVRDETANLAGAAVTFMGVLVSFIAWRHIKAQPDRLTGLKLAKWGTLGPLGLYAIAMFASFVIFTLVVEPGQALERDQSEQQARAEMAREHLRASLHAHLERLSAMGGMAPLNDIASTIDPAARDALLAMDNVEFKRACDADELGLAMIDQSSLPGPLSEYQLDRMVIVGNMADVRIRDGDSYLSFSMVLADGRWYLHVSPVVRGG